MKLNKNWFMNESVFVPATNSELTYPNKSLLKVPSLCSFLLEFTDVGRRLWSSIQEYDTLELKSALVMERGNVSYFSLTQWLWIYIFRLYVAAIQSNVKKIPLVASGVMFNINEGLGNGKIVDNTSRVAVTIMDLDSSDMKKMNDSDENEKLYDITFQFVDHSSVSEYSLNTDLQDMIVRSGMLVPEQVSDIIHSGSLNKEIIYDFNIYLTPMVCNFLPLIDYNEDFMTNVEQWLKKPTLITINEAELFRNHGTTYQKLNLMFLWSWMVIAMSCKPSISNTKKVTDLLQEFENNQAADWSLYAMYAKQIRELSRKHNVTAEAMLEFLQQFVLAMYETAVNRVEAAESAAQLFDGIGEIMLNAFEEYYSGDKGVPLNWLLETI